jgi:hypothetical protein
VTPVAVLIRLVAVRMAETVDLVRLEVQPAVIPEVIPEDLIRDLKFWGEFLL